MKVFVVEQKRTKRKYLVLNNFVVRRKSILLIEISEWKSKRD